MDPIEAARAKIKQYLDDANNLDSLVIIANNEGDFTAAASIRALLGKTIADAGAFCASLVGVTLGEPAPE